MGSYKNMEEEQKKALVYALLCSFVNFGTDGKIFVYLTGLVFILRKSFQTTVQPLRFILFN